MNELNDPLIGKVVRNSIGAWKEKESKLSESTVYLEYKKSIFLKIIFIVSCVLIAVVSAGLALTIGEYEIGFFESYQILFNHIFGNVPDTVEAGMKDYVVYELRLPRILVGLITGAGLAVAGAAMQSILKNPLADPYTTGVSSGAGFGASIAIVMGATIASGQYAIVVNAFMFALVPTAVILFISKIKGSSPITMIMAGIAVMYIFGAMTTIIKLWADPDSLSALYRWQVGTLAGADWAVIPIMAIVTIIGCISVQLLSGKLNILSTGDDNAKSLGIDADKLRMICLIITALISAVIVSFTGLIGFVGLVAPHIVRLFIGPDNRYLIVASAFFGAALLVLADLIGRTIISPTVLQVGVITAFLGGPLFLWLIIRKTNRAW